MDLRLCFTILELCIFLCAQIGHLNLLFQPPCDDGTRFGLMYKNEEISKSSSVLLRFQAFFQFVNFGFYFVSVLLG